MADNKYERYVQLFPKTFRPQDGDKVLENLPADATTGKTISELWNENVANPVLNAVLRGFAQGDLDVSTALEATKASLFVKTAENQQLDVIASSLGVSRPGSLGLSDSAFQNLVPPLSLGAKQVRSAFYNAMDAFYGPEFSRANLVTVNTTDSLFDLQLNDSLSFIVDDGETQTITIRTTSGIANFGQATALELNNLIKDNLTGVTSEILTDPITKIETVRVLTTTPGLRGSIQFSVNRPSTTQTFNVGGATVFSPDVTGLNEIAIQNTSLVGLLRVGDVIILDLDGVSPLAERTVTSTPRLGRNGVFVADSVAIFAINDTSGILTGTTEMLRFFRIFNETPVIFPLEKAELLKQDQRTAVYEITPNNVIIELPAVLPSLQRGLKGALHVHNGPLLNQLIFRGETTNIRIPDNLFDDTRFEEATNRFITPVSLKNNSTVVFKDRAGNTVTGTTPVNDIVITLIQFNTADLTNNSIVVGDILVGEANRNGINYTYEYDVIRIADLTPADPLTQFVDVGITSITPTLGEFDVSNSDLQLGLESIIGTRIVSTPPAPDSYTITGSLPFSYNATTRILEVTPDAGQALDVYEFTLTNDADSAESFTFFLRVDNRIAPAADQQIWEGAFIFDPNGTQTAFTVSGESAVITGDAITGATTLAAGRVFPRVNVEAETNNLPDESGFAVIGFGSETQEPALIRYRGKASSSIIELDPSFVFTRNQPAGTYINIVSSPTPFIPDRIGSDYPIYLTSSTEARIVVQDILQSLAAAGVVVTFVVLAPEYKYLIDNPYLTTDDAPIV